jgi:hypothetical protein
MYIILCLEPHLYCDTTATGIAYTFSDALQGRAESGADFASLYELRIAYPADNSENLDRVLRKMRKPRARSTGTHRQFHGRSSGVKYMMW